MQDQNNHVQPSEQQSASPYSNYLYPAANNYSVDSSQGHYGVMNPYNMYPVNQWPHAEGMHVTSSMMGIPTMTASSTDISSNSSGTSSIMSVNPNAPVSSSMAMGSNPSSVGSNMASYMDPAFYPVMHQFPMNKLINGVVSLSRSTLYPTNSLHVQNPSNMPHSCSGILVKGLPEKATEDDVKDLFDKFGKIRSIQAKENNSYIIEYFFRSCIDRTFTIHGWKMKIENKDEAPYSGTIHIEYASEEAKESETAEEVAESRTQSPDSSVPYSDCEIAALSEKLDDENDFEEAVKILITWLQRGECNKRNSCSFYSVIQKTNKQVQKLMNEKAKFEENVNKAKISLNDKMIGVTEQLQEFEKVLSAARLQKVWDHFTKAQRKNIDNWSKEISEIRSECTNELINRRVEDEMEMSDEEGGETSSKEDISSMDEDIDTLQNQINAAKQELREIRLEKAEKVVSIRENFQTTLLKYKETAKKIDDLKSLLEQDSKSNESTEESGNQPKQASPDAVQEAIECIPLEMTGSETRQIGLIATFLNVHPFGASLDYIASFLYTINSNVNIRDVESLMKQCPTVFKEETQGIGPTFKKLWKFKGFEIPR